LLFASQRAALRDSQSAILSAKDPIMRSSRHLFSPSLIGRQPFGHTPRLVFSILILFVAGWLGLDSQMLPLG